MTGDLTETLTAVLGEHEFQSGSGWGRPSCSCDEWTTDERHYEQIHAAHRAHVAAVLAALVAAEREKAVLEAADAMDAELATKPARGGNLRAWWTVTRLRAYAARMHAATEGGDR